MTVTNILRLQGSEESSGQRGQFSAALDLAHGGSPTLAISYELAGPVEAPVLLLAGGISADRHVIANSSDANDGWWQVQAETFAPFRVLAINWVGCEGDLDRPIDAADQAKALLATLDHLGIDGAAGFIGASYGAMVGMHLAAIAPERVGRLLAISAADRAHPFASAHRALQRQAVELGERFGSGEAGVALARKMAVLTYRTAEEFGERFADSLSIEQGRAKAGAEPYLDHMGIRHCRKMSSVAYRRLSESIDLHRIDPARITIPATFVAVESDQLVPAAHIRALAGAVRDGEYLSLSSVYGHDAFLKEEQAVAAIIHNFLSSLEQAQ